MVNNPPVVWRQHKELHKMLGQRGKVVVWTRVYVAPEGFEHETPYISAIVEFQNKKRMAVQVTDFDGDLKEGREVIIVVRRIGKASPDGLIRYGVKVIPL